MGRSRDIANFIGKTEISNTDNKRLLTIDTDPGIDSAEVADFASQVVTTYYSTLDSLPISGLTAGDQAYVASNSRLYISNGSGWYNVALVNRTPTMSLSPAGTIVLASDGVTTSTVTITAQDSDDPEAILTYSVESDGNGIGKYVISQDSSVFTIRPLSSDSGATDGTFTLTFKTTDQINTATDTKDFSLTFSSIDSISFSANDQYILRLPSETSTVTVNTTGYSNGATIPYTITGVTSADITNSLTGNYTVGSPIVLTGVGVNKTRANQTGTFSAGGVSGTFYVQTKQTALSNNPFSATPWVVVRDGWYNVSDNTGNASNIIIGPIVSASYGGGISLRLRKFLAGEPGSTSTYQMYAGNAGKDIYHGDFRAIKIYGVLNGTPTHTHTFTWAQNCGEMRATSAQSTYRYAMLGSVKSGGNIVTRTFTHSSYSGTYIDNICFIEYYSNAAATSLINTSYWTGTGGYLV